MQFEKLSPVLFVERIEPCLAFWIERLGFELLAEVKGEDGLAFALLSAGAVSVMLQTNESLADDIPQASKRYANTSACLYVHVDDLDEVERRVEGVEVVVPRRETFYGATELGVREPGGNLVLFSKHQATTEPT